MVNLIPNRGNYRNLLCYKKAEAIYDITCHFVGRFLHRGDRTIDQMVQAARSGKQNIVEGYAASATSVETELKLVNVAKSSLQELLVDYDGLHRWEKHSRELVCAQQLGREHNDTAFWMELVRTRSDEVIANIAIVLIYQTDYLLYKYLQAAGERFLNEGGFREKLTRERLKARNGGKGL